MAKKKAAKKAPARKPAKRKAMPKRGPVIVEPVEVDPTRPKDTAPPSPSLPRDAGPKEQPGNVYDINGTPCQCSVWGDMDKRGNGKEYGTADGLALTHGCVICEPLDPDTPRFVLEHDEFHDLAGK